MVKSHQSKFTCTIENFFIRVDWAIQAALDNNLAIVVNIHHFEGVPDPTNYKEKLFSMWKQIVCY